MTEMSRDELIERLKALAPEFRKIMMQYGAHDPDWEPLEKVLTPEQCDGFMFMGYCDGKRMYKHYWTRRYLNLDPDGNAYLWYGETERYRAVPLSQAIALALEGYEPPDPDTLPTEPIEPLDRGPGWVLYGPRDEEPDPGD